MIDICSVLKLNNIDYRDKHDQVLVHCPFREEGNPSLYIKKDTGIYHCFGCDKAGHFAEYLAEVTKNDIFDTMCYIEGQGGFGEREYKREYKQITSLEDLQKSYRLFKYKANRYLTSRGVVNPDLFECGYDNLNNRISIPVKYQGEIVGFETRVLEAGNPYDKYKALFFPKTKYLYGWDELDSRYPFVILVESAISVMYLRNTLKLHNIVAFMGTAISERQLELLKEFNPEIVFCWFDNDRAGKKAYQKVKAQMKCIQISSDKDPDEFTLQEIMQFKEEI